MTEDYINVYGGYAIKLLRLQRALGLTRFDRATRSAGTRLTALLLPICGSDVGPAGHADIRRSGRPPKSFDFPRLFATAAG